MLLAGLFVLALEGGACAVLSPASPRPTSARPPAVAVSVPVALVSVPLGRSAVLRSSVQPGALSPASPRTADLRLPATLLVLPRFAREASPARAEPPHSRPLRRLRRHAPPSITG